MKNKLSTILCYCITVITAMGCAVISPLLSEISRDYSLTAAQSGFIFTINSIGFVSFIPLGMILIKQWGKKITLSVMLSGYAAVLLLLPVLRGYYMLCIIMLLLGGFNGIIQSVNNSLVTDLNKENSSFYLNLGLAFFGVGAVIGITVAGLITSNSMYWGICYSIIGALSLIVTAAFTMNKLPYLEEQHQKASGGLKSLLGENKFLLICLCIALYSGSEVGGWGWICTYLKEVLKFTTVESNLAIILFWIAMSAGRVLCGYLTLKFEPKSLIILFAVSSAIIVFLSGLVTSKAFIWFIVAGMGFTYSGQWALLASYGSNFTKASSGMAFSVMNTIGGMGVMAIPYMMGLINENVNMNVSMMSPSITLFSVAVIVLFMEKRAQQPQNMVESLQT